MKTVIVGTVLVALGSFALPCCDVFLFEVGSPGEPCYDDNTCDHGLECHQGACTDQSACSPDPCNGHGACTNGTCTCNTGFTGSTCNSCATGYTGYPNCLFHITFVSIPGGSFMMGSDFWNADERPVHSVSVPAFEMLETEVTVAQYRACVDAGACSSPATGEYCNWDVAGRDDHPVNCVDWWDAVDFCAFANARLPSEAEWEYAARGGGQAITYPWGDQAPSCTYAVMNEGGHGCGQDRTWAVCSKPAGNTAQGLCDMAGNVWEWVRDWYHSTYAGAPADGSAWESPSGSDRVLRGGCFRSVDVLRAASRLYYAPSVRKYDFGFRCAR